VQVNGLQAKIKSMTRQMMATVSELSMYQASALRLQQQVREKECLLEKYKINIDKGLPPSMDVEQEYIRQTQLEERQQRERHHAKLVLFHSVMFACCVY